MVNLSSRVSVAALSILALRTALIPVLIVVLFTGCATTDDQQTSEEMRLKVLYPRRYVDSFPPWERRHAEYEIEGQEPLETKRK